MVRLTEIEVRELFGHRDISMKLPPDPVSFIHGPNGVGKSTLLRLINNLLTRDLISLQAVQFTEVRLRLDPWGEVTARVDGDELTISHGDHSFSVPRMDSGRRAAARDYLERVGFEVVDGQWMDMDTGETHSMFEALALALERRPMSASFMRELGDWSIPPDTDPWFPEISVELIQTDRLRVSLDSSQQRAPRPRFAQHRRRPTVDQPLPTRQQAHLSNLMQTTQAAYAERSQEIDRNFPLRLVQELGRKEAPTEEELTHEFQKVERLREQLKSVQLLDETQIQAPVTNASPEIRSTLQLYLQDTANKLNALTGLAQRIGAFTEILNGKFEGKTLIVDRRWGYRVLDDLGREIPPRALSSGEQHQLVLLYSLIFRDEGPCLFLIDEPELSLHVSWQEEVIPDLESISASSESQFLLATHSPVVIGERSDLLVDLEVHDHV